MSYSFSVRGATKTECMEKVAAELDKVVSGQPIHSADREQAKAAVWAFLDVLPNSPEKQDLSVSVSGSLSWNGADNAITSANVNISAGFLAK